MEKWRNNSDSALELPLNEKETVRDSLQTKRDEQAEALRNERRERDELRAAAKRDAEESMSKYNQILSILRGADHPKQPETLRQQADSKNEQADQIQEGARVKRDVFQRRFGETIDETQEEAFKIIQESLREVATEINVGKFSEFENEALKRWEKINYEDIKNSVFSDAKGEYSDKTIGERALQQLITIEESLRRRTEGDFLGEGSFLEVFNAFNERLLSDMTLEKGEIYTKSSNEVLRLLMGTGWDMPEKIKQLIVDGIESMPLDSLERAWNLSMHQFWHFNKALVLGAKNVEQFIGNKIQNALETETVSTFIEQSVEYPAIFELFTTQIGSYLESRYGIHDGKAMAKAWKNGAIWPLEQNLEMLKLLESAEGGAVKLLHEEYGINEFARYPIDLLVEQARNHEKDVPYGAMIFPSDDHNGAFDKINLDEFYQGTQGKHTTRIFEASSTTDLARYFIKMEKRQNKIGYLLLAAHGETDGMSFGIEERGFLDIKTLEKMTTLPRLRALLEDDASVALVSCSTGADEGFAQVLSEKTNTEIQAPKVTAYGQRISVHYEEGKPKMTVEFDVAQETYKNGKAIADK
jgi:hypothetical protein